MTKSIKEKRLRGKAAYQKKYEFKGSHPRPRSRGVNKFGSK